MCRDRIETATERAGGAVSDATGAPYDPKQCAEQAASQQGRMVDSTPRGYTERLMTRDERTLFELHQRAERANEKAMVANRVYDILARHPEFLEFLEVLRSGLVVLLLLFFATAGHAQTKPTADTLQTTIAEQAVTIARLQAQVHELQFQVNLYDSAMGTSSRRSEDQQAIQAAEQASIAAHKVVPAAPAVKPAIPKK